MRILLVRRKVKRDVKLNKYQTQNYKFRIPTHSSALFSRMLDHLIYLA